MPAERAGFTVTMFLVDVSPSMGKLREVEVPNGPNGETMTIEMTNLEYSLQFVKLKIQEMIFNGRKTDQCGVILFGTDDTDNIVNEKNGGYEHVTEYIPIAQPDAGTLAKISAIQPSETTGDAIDALIVGIETQHQYLTRKATWTRKIVLITDGESPIEIEDWEATVKKMNSLEIGLTIVGIDFDEEELPFHEEDKSDIKRMNESFYHTLASKMDRGVVGNAEFALQELSRPEIRQVKSTMTGTILRIGDVESRAEEAIEIYVKTAKYTAKAPLPKMKRFSRRIKMSGEDDERMEVDEDEDKTVWAQLARRTEFYIDRGDGATEDGVSEAGDAEDESKGEKVEKEELIRGFKYGASYVPCPDNVFPHLPTVKGMEICGFFKAENFKRWQEMGEVYYVFADPDSPMQQVALSALVRAMAAKQSKLAIARWVRTNGADPKMGVMWPMVVEDQIDYLMWVRMPFADDIRNFPFASLEKLVTKTGEVVKSHPYLPTEDQVAAMEQFVDAMDLMDAGEKNEDGVREPWFDVRLSYNPALHRLKQALFHAAIVDDLATHPLPPPHPELTKYFEPPRRVLKRAREPTEQCKATFNVREIPAKVARTRKDNHVRARDEDEDILLLDKMAKRPPTSSQMPASQRPASQRAVQASPSRPKDKGKARTGGDSSASESETEPESDAEDLLLSKGPHLPTPTQSPEPDPGRAPGRIIGNTYPLEDFRQNIARGDVVTKAVEDLAEVIKEIVTKPFASRRTEEMLQCMRTLRKVALEEDEIDAWNAFLRQLRHVCLEERPGNKDFWEHVQGEGREISLISKSEASKFGGASDVTDAYAVQFINQQ
ncbi:ku80-like protein [Obba rivulosa]|uniref:ATP-dependent DNA helicase II subunit 2 n=1 Tax=Obba rivulosa TaxID=1052685 RepID=A0A8E2DFD5_9APHY|nr:ku80-like protein [Obba rivulosa]